MVSALFIRPILQCVQFTLRSTDRVRRDLRIDTSTPLFLSTYQSISLNSATRLDNFLWEICYITVVSLLQSIYKIVLKEPFFRLTDEMEIQRQQPKRKSDVWYEEDEKRNNSSIARDNIGICMFNSVAAASVSTSTTVAHGVHLTDVRGNWWNIPKKNQCRQIHWRILRSLTIRSK